MKLRVSPSFLRFLSIIVGLLLFLNLLSKVGLKEFVGFLSEISIPTITIALLVYALVWFLRTWRLKKLANVFNDQIPLYDLFKIHITANAINAVLPAKAGDMAMVIFLKGRKFNLGTSASLVLTTRMLDFFALLGLLLPSAYLMSEISTLSPFLLPMKLCLLVLLLPIGLVLFDKKNRFTRLLEFIESRLTQKFWKFIASKSKDAFNSFRMIIFNRRLFLFTLIESAVIWAGEGIVCWVIALSLGASGIVWNYIVAVVIANFGKLIPITPGGIGIYESLLTVVLVFFGTPLEVAIVISICEHILKKFINCAFGFIYLPSLGIGLKDGLLKAG